MTEHIGDVQLKIQPGDITTVQVDAIVNAANSTLLGGGGVDGAIHSAGGPEILQACKALRAEEYPDGLPAGQAVATTAGNMAATWVIHTVGPVFSKAEDRSETLASAYRNSLAVAQEVGAESVAFPAISAGVYGWPMDDAARIALSTVAQEAPRVAPDVKTVVFVPFGDEATQLFQAALDNLNG